MSGWVVAAPWGARKGTGSSGSLPQGSSGGCIRSRRVGLPVTRRSSGLGMAPVPAAAMPVPAGPRGWVPWSAVGTVLHRVLRGRPGPGRAARGCQPHQRDASSAGAAVVFQGCLAMGARLPGWV